MKKKQNWGDFGDSVYIHIFWKHVGFEKSEWILKGNIKIDIPKRQRTYKNWFIHNLTLVELETFPI